MRANITLIGVLLVALLFNACSAFPSRPDDRALAYNEVNNRSIPTGVYVTVAEVPAPQGDPARAEGDRRGEVRRGQAQPGGHDRLQQGEGDQRHAALGINV
jgi:hypothetical protein